MTPLEIEVKFYLPEPGSLRQRILALRPVDQGRVFEKNVRFEHPDRSLAQRKMLLRLRQDHVARLTLKSPPPDDDGEFKIHREVEVEVSDFAKMVLILEGLGYFPAQIYEKWRETYIIGDVQVLLDTLPFGDFLEIEGSKTAIKETAARLDLPWEKRIITHYLAIFEQIKQAYNLSFADITFAAFENLTLDIAPLIIKMRPERDER